MSSISIPASWLGGRVSDVENLYADGNEVGSDASGVMVHTQNYLTSYSQMLSGLPLKIRIGGRSSENYTYVEAFGQQEPKPSDGSGQLYSAFCRTYRRGLELAISSVSRALRSSETGAGLMIFSDLSLKDPSGQSLTKFATSSKMMIQTIEGYTLGSVWLCSPHLFRRCLICIRQGPDRYISEGIRPNASNYTVDDYAAASPLP